MSLNTSNEFANDRPIIRDFLLEEKGYIFYEKSKKIDINPITALAVRALRCIGKVAVCKHPYTARDSTL